MGQYKRCRNLQNGMKTNNHPYKLHVGLYNIAIGKVCARITAVKMKDDMQYNAEFGEITR